MAKQKTVTITVTVCDGCGVECGYTRECMKCKAAFCYECRDKKGIRYSFALYLSGSADGFYCIPCDQELKRSNPKDLMHSAYLKIDDLHAEHRRWDEDFKRRVIAAQDNLVCLQRAAK